MTTGSSVKRATQQVADIRASRKQVLETRLVTFVECVPSRIRGACRILQMCKVTSDGVQTDELHMKFATGFKKIHPGKTFKLKIAHRWE